MPLTTAPPHLCVHDRKYGVPALPFLQHETETMTVVGGTLHRVGRNAVINPLGRRRVAELELESRVLN